LSYLWLPRGLRSGLRANASAAFNPARLSKISAWLRLQASTQSGGEWTNWADVLNSNPVAYNSARRPAVAAAANALPIATFNPASPVVGAWPLTAANNQTAKTGVALWMKPAVVTGGANQVIYMIAPGTGGANLQKFQVVQNNRTLVPWVAVTAGTANGRQLTTGNVLTVSTWAWVRLEYDSSRGGDANLKVYVNGADAGGAYSDIGAGGTLGTLATVTGNALMGNFNDGSAVAPWSGDFGPNLFVLSDNLTAAEETALMNFERPT
jgi:hypothetical protein